MTKEIEYLRTVDKETFLGYCRCNVFQTDSHFSLSDVFSTSLLSDKYDQFIIEMYQERGISIAELIYDFGPFDLAKTNINDFKKFSYAELLRELNEYWTDETWGEDLSLFKKNFDKVISFLKNYELENREFYYLNLEQARKEILPFPEGIWIYFVGIFSLDIENQNLIVMCFGND